ncbi:MAG: amidohydrolase [Pyrinomonadaceae bacterium]
MKIKVYLFLCVLTFTNFQTNSQTLFADLIVINANVRTMDEKLPRTRSIAVSKNRIIFVGKESDTKKYVNANTKIIDAKGKLVIPGFNDAHVHILGMGNIFSAIDLRFAKSAAEMSEKIKYQVRFLPSGRWILGGQWNNENWLANDLPNKDSIDAFTSDNPIFLYNQNPKIAFANSAALKLSGINEDISNPPGGEFVRDKTGKLAGVLKGSAINFVRRAAPVSPTKNRLEVIETATNYAAAYGVTSMQDMSADDNTDIFRELEKQGKLKTRIYDCYGLSEWLKSGSPKFEKIDDSILYRRGCLKYFAESDTESIPDLSKKIALADRNGWQVMIHAIGGASNNVILSVFENVIKENGEKDRRFRVEHAHSLRPDDVKRFGISKIIPSMQPALFFGSVLNGSEPYRSLIQTNARIAFGSDSSMIPINPFDGIYAAVIKSNSTKSQSLSVEEAVRFYTSGAAYAEFQENVKGTISVGKLADFIILSDDIFTIKAEEIPKTKILTTVMDGKIVYQAR